MRLVDTRNGPFLVDENEVASLGPMADGLTIITLKSGSSIPTIHQPDEACKHLGLDGAMEEARAMRAGKAPGQLAEGGNG